MPRLDNAAFISQIENLLQSNGGKSSVYLSQKRLVPALDLESVSGISDLPSNVIPQDITPPGTTINHTTYPLLIRVSLNGSDQRKSKKDKVKLSTVVEPGLVEQFWVEYSQALKTGFMGLKKKEKKKEKKKAKGKVLKS